MEYKMDTLNSFSNNLSASTSSNHQEKSYSLGSDLSSKRPSLFVSSESSDATYKSAFLTYIRKGQEGALQNFEEKGLSSDNEGGYLIPQTLKEKIDHKLKISSPIRSLSNVMTISTDALDLVVEKGNLGVSWVAENTQRDETKTPEFVKIKIPLHELAAAPRITQKLLDDSQMNLETWVVDRIAEQMARAENLAFIQGDGQNKPKGFLMYAAEESDDFGKLEMLKTGENGGFSSKNSAHVLIDLMHHLKSEYLPGASWVMPRSALAVIRKITDPSTGHYLWQPSLSLDTPSTLLGFPVIITDDMPTLTTGKASLSIAFGNFKEAYQIVDRSDIHMLRDPYSAKPFVEFYASKRVGGDIVNFDALKILSFSSK